MALDDVILPLLAAEAITFVEKENVLAQEEGETAKVCNFISIINFYQFFKMYFVACYLDEEVDGYSIQEKTFFMG